MISNYQSCCESWGHFLSEDNPAEFIGATLVDVKITDELLNKKRLSELDYLDEGGVMFVDIETDRGVLQFVAYNSHNGYYSHSATVESKQLTHETYL
jgi:hypothetical protein